ncbi:MAG: hypothetical protein WD826_12275 [Actinomycetota bacterium]
MTPRRLSLIKRLRTRARVCPNCALILDRPLKRCPRCDAPISKEREDNIADKTGADSFPASDPPPY